MQYLSSKESNNTYRYQYPTWPVSVFVIILARICIQQKMVKCAFSLSKVCKNMHIDILKIKGKIYVRKKID